MPLKGDICEGIPIVPMLLEVPTLRRNKFRDPVHGLKACEYSKRGSMDHSSNRRC